MVITPLTQIPTVPPSQVAPESLLITTSTTRAVILKCIPTGSVTVRVARYLDGDWCWHPAGDLVFDSAGADGGRRWERLVIDDQAARLVLVKVAGDGTIGAGKASLIPVEL